MLKFYIFFYVWFLLSKFEKWNILIGVFFVFIFGIFLVFIIKLFIIFESFECFLC